MAIMLFLLLGCSKESRMKGRYTASTASANFTIELLDDNRCVGSISGGEESQGSYHVKGDEISISLLLRKGGILDRDYKCYGFHKNGKIESTSTFTILAEDMNKDDDLLCTFVKRN